MGKRSYGTLIDVMPINLDYASTLVGFQVSQTTLLQTYGQVLVNPEIQGVYVDAQSVDYYLVHKTSSGTFLTNLEFDKNTVTAKIKSLASISTP